MSPIPFLSIKHFIINPKSTKLFIIIHVLFIYTINALSKYATILGIKEELYDIINLMIKQ